MQTTKQSVVKGYAKRKTKVSDFLFHEEAEGHDIITEIRQYQKTIFENCRDKNSIIFLETGTGKTLISILLINYYLRKFNKTKKVTAPCNQRNKFFQKKIAFLANEVNLIQQQAQKIEKLLPEVQKQLKEEIE